MITKAIIPVAGWGTRRLPITKAIEKCMLPIGNRPIVDYVVEDCIRAGIRDIYFVVGEQSSQIHTYYGENKLLNEYLRTNGKEGKIAEITPPKNVNFHYIIQPQNEKYGTAIPVALCADEVEEGESVVVLMGDDFIYNKDGSSEVQRLIEATPAGKSSLLGVEVPQEEVSKYGVLRISDANDFIEIVEKPNQEEAPSNLINISKYVVSYELMQEITRFADEEYNDGEYYITVPINHYVESGASMKVVPAKGEYLDGGSLEGWLHANDRVCRDNLV